MPNIRVMGQLSESGWEDLNYVQYVSLLTMYSPHRKGSYVVITMHEYRKCNMIAERNNNIM